MLGCIYARAFAASCIDFQNYTQIIHTPCSDMLSTTNYFSQKMRRKCGDQSFYKNNDFSIWENIEPHPLLSRIKGQRGGVINKKLAMIAKSVELSPVLPSLYYVNFSRHHSCFTGCREERPSFPFFRQSNQIILSPPSAIISRYGVTGSLYNLRVTGCMSRRTRHIHKVLIIRMCALFQYYIVLDYSSLPPPPRRYRGLE